MTLANSLHRLHSPVADPCGDAELVARFVNGDERAFTVLFRRHGPSVYGVCLRLLGNPEDADEAVPAVFLLLAHKAAGLRDPGAVGSWLYGVAFKTAMKVRAKKAKRRKRELASQQVREPKLPGNPAPTGHSDTLAVIYAEIAALPDRLRAAFVACILNGRTRSEAASDLRCPEGTVKTRLADAREVLAKRLKSRGIELGVVVLAAVAVPTATATQTLAAVRKLLAAGPAVVTLTRVLVAVLAVTVSTAGGWAVTSSSPSPQPAMPASRPAVARSRVPDLGGPWQIVSWGEIIPREARDASDFTMVFEREDDPSETVRVRLAGLTTRKPGLPSIDGSKAHTAVLISNAQWEHGRYVSVANDTENADESRIAYWLTPARPTSDHDVIPVVYLSFLEGGPCFNQSLVECGALLADERPWHPLRDKFLEAERVARSRGSEIPMYELWDDKRRDAVAGAIQRRPPVRPTGD